jgi:hypothetical protein
MAWRTVHACSLLTSLLSHSSCRSVCTPAPLPPPTATPPPKRPAQGKALDDRPLSSTLVTASTTASAGLLASLWLSISALLTVAASVAGSLTQVQFLWQLLQMWGATSSTGLQLLLQKLQLVGSGRVLAPPQLERYKRAVQGVAWATTDWTGEQRLSERKAVSEPLKPAIGCCMPPPLWQDGRLSLVTLTCSAVLQAPSSQRGQTSGGSQLPAKQTTPGGPAACCWSWLGQRSPRCWPTAWA